MKRISIYFDENNPADMNIYNYLENIGRKHRGTLIKTMSQNAIDRYENLFYPQFATALINVIANETTPTTSSGHYSKSNNTARLLVTSKPKKTKTKKSESTSATKKSVETKSVIRIESDENPIPDTKVSTSQLEVATTINSEPAQTNSSSPTEKPKKFDYGFMNAYIGDDDVFD